MRSQLGRARGLGASKSGVEHWWVERVTAIALVPLTIWFIVSVLTLLHSDQPEVRQWAGRPVNTVLLLATVIMTFHHMQLGLQVVIDDYVKKSHLAVTLLNKGAALLLGLFSIVAILKMAF
ncbi:succinate dehydrogenase, hydrophobic membrane anchor protein [Lichenicoccus roseus]|uniref:Succinate dehydrogenase hydrophobic membrane anchor subunit n=1 Tax=Lichenicoccus roseus TaxID=2683649 RepID=A0A5R9J5I8_9PROT|nr:succinate dehydrogenase, hydrophobic membrane anchor protein [Lichenicoccus roseus]TLU72822.1 succinate dehydrogenase, hydrophobic membrane anchor protein [Lichenicoccus roseus]